MTSFASRPPESAAEEALVENGKSAELLMKEVERAQSKLIERSGEPDPITGARTITPGDLQQLIEFNRNVQKSTGSNFFCFQTMYASMASNYQKAREAAEEAEKEAAKEKQEDEKPKAIESFTPPDASDLV